MAAINNARNNPRRKKFSSKVAPEAPYIADPAFSQGMAYMDRIRHEEDAARRLQATVRGNAARRRVRENRAG